MEENLDLFHFKLPIDVHISTDASVRAEIHGSCAFHISSKVFRWKEAGLIPRFLKHGIHEAELDAIYYSLRYLFRRLPSHLEISRLFLHADSEDALEYLRRFQSSDEKWILKKKKLRPEMHQKAEQIASFLKEIIVLPQHVKAHDYGNSSLTSRINQECDRMASEAFKSRVSIEEIVEGNGRKKKNRLWKKGQDQISHFDCHLYPHVKDFI